MNEPRLGTQAANFALLRELATNIAASETATKNSIGDGLTLIRQADERRSDGNSRVKEMKRDLARLAADILSLEEEIETQYSADTRVAHEVLMSIASDSSESADGIKQIASTFEPQQSPRRSRPKIVAQ